MGMEGALDYLEDCLDLERRNKWTGGFVNHDHFIVSSELGHPIFGQIVLDHGV